MAESGIQLPPDSTGKTLRTQTGGPNLSHMEVHVLADADGTLASVSGLAKDATLTSGAVRVGGTVTVAQSGTVVTDVNDRAARLLGHVTVDNLPTTQPVSGTVTVSNQPDVSLLARDSTLSGVTTSLGTDGTTAPAVGTGVRGWLRQIAERVAGVLTVTSTSGATSGTLTAAWDGVAPSASPAGSTVTLTVPEGHSSSGITLGGTFSAATVVNFEGSDDGVYWFALNHRRNLDTNTNDTTNVLDANPTGGPPPNGANPSHWRGNVGGVAFLRVRCSVLTAGDSVTVGLRSSVGVGTTFLNSPTVTRSDIGIYSLAAGTGGATVTPTAGQRIQSVAVIAPTGSAATVQIASWPVVTVPAGQQVALNPNSNLKGTGYPVVITGSASYVVELVG